MDAQMIDQLLKVAPRLQSAVPSGRSREGRAEQIAQEDVADPPEWEPVDGTQLFRRSGHLSSTRAGAAAVWRMWFDCTAPTVTSVSTPVSNASPDEELELAGLVAATSEPGQVVVLDPDLETAEVVRQAAKRMAPGRHTSKPGARPAVE